MKTKRFILGMMACAALCACSDDPSENGSVKPTLTGDQAYLTVRINYANDTRANDGGLEYGSAKEHDIKSADFYFYDEKGVFVSQANVWDGGTANTNDPTENIEFKGESVVVLKGLEGKGYPKYMVTVLNAPGSFTPGATLKEMETKMAGDYKNSNGYFIMSTTSYVHTPDGTATVPNYFVTEITEDNFETEPVANPQNAVEVFVERLAAKVTLDFDNTSLVPVSGQPNTYSIKVTVAGNDNEGENQPGGSGTTPDIGAEEMYVHILGWGLTATTQDSYMMKNIDTGWNLAWKTANNVNYDWNDATRFRSYWGKSYNYGTGDYPASAGASTNATLKYLTANEVLALAQGDGVGNVGKSQYCNENTNTKEIVTEHFTNAVTNIMLIAKVTAPDGTELNYVKYRGVLYKEADFIKYVLNRSQYTGAIDLNLWTKTGEGAGAVFTQIDENKFELEHKGDGVVIVKMKALAAGEKLYSLNAGATPDAGGNYAETDFTEKDLTIPAGETLPAFIKDINDALAAFDASNQATGFKGGLMYYTIPIEHLNNADNVTEGGQTYKPEGRYGIVRNHHYKVTVNSLIRLGQGIFDPSEIVIPGAGDPKETYYVGATINVLSWKIVDQTVGL